MKEDYMKIEDEQGWMYDIMQGVWQKVRNIDSYVNENFLE